jgi:TolA-binding protein
MMTARFRHATRSLAIALLVGLLGSTASAQNPAPTPEQYQDALNQMKALQERINTMAGRNQELQKRLAEMEQQRQTMSVRLETLENRAYYLREHYNAWQAFLEQNPPLRVMWYTYFTGGALKESISDLFGDGKWPFSVEG